MGWGDGEESIVWDHTHVAVRDLALMNESQHSHQLADYSSSFLFREGLLLDDVVKQLLPLVH